MLNSFGLKLVLCIDIECFCIFGGIQLLSAVSIKFKFSFVSNLILIFIVSHVDSKKTHTFLKCKTPIQIYFCIFASRGQVWVSPKSNFKHAPSWNFKHASFSALPQTFINTQYPSTIENSSVQRGIKAHLKKQIFLRANISSTWTRW